VELFMRRVAVEASSSSTRTSKIPWSNFLHGLNFCDRQCLIHFFPPSAMLRFYGTGATTISAQSSQLT
jgi:hypothetical protein